MYVWAKVESQPGGTKTKGDENPHTLLSLWAWLLATISHKYLLYINPKIQGNHHFVNAKTKTQGGQMIMFKVSQMTASLNDRTRIQTASSDCKVQDTRIHGLGKTQQHVPSCIKLYSFHRCVISKILRRKSWLQNGIIGFICNEALGTVGMSKQNMLLVLIYVLFIVCEGEVLYQLQKLLRGFNCVIRKAHSRTYIIGVNLWAYMTHLFRENKHIQTAVFEGHNYFSHQ